MSDVDALKAKADGMRKDIMDARKQLQILNQLKPLRAAVKNLAVRSKNTKDVKVKRRLAAQRAMVMARIAKLKMDLTTSTTQEAMRKRILAMAERFRELNVKITEARTSQSKA